MAIVLTDGWIDRGRAVDWSFLDIVGGPWVALGIIAAIAFLAVLPSLLTKKEESKFERRSCTACGWTGNVSTFRPRCPKCAKPIE